MQIVHSVDALGALPRAGVTIGNFDGVHKGHQTLIRRTLDVCCQEGLACVLVTFWPHPRLVVSPHRSHAPLTSRERRLELLAGLGVEHVLELPFTREMAALTPADFVRMYLLPMHMRQLVVGYDFSLGRGRSGHIDVLRALGAEMGFGVEQLPPVILDDAVVSSTRLRDLISQGGVWEAARLLGRCYGFSGEVVHGDGRGEGLGFPTANLLPPETLLPAEGVYATRVRLSPPGAARQPVEDDGKHGEARPEQAEPAPDRCCEVWHQAVTNVGRKPTFGGRDVSVESFLLDTSANLYGQRVRLEFVARLRGERRFASVEELTHQIGKDVAEARQILDKDV